MNKHYEYDVLPHMREAREKLPWTVEATIWTSQFVVEYCVHQFFPGGFDDLLPGAKQWATDHNKLQRGVAFYLSGLVAKQSLDQKKKSYYSSCEPFAWIEKGFFQLAQGIHEFQKDSKDSDDSYKHIPLSSACMIWEVMRLIEYQNLMGRLGILDGCPPEDFEKPKGKVFQLEKAFNLLDDLTFDLKRGEKSTVWVKRTEIPPMDLQGKPVFWDENPRLYLLLTAHYLAQEEEEFWHKYWEPFQGECGRSLRKMRRSNKYHVSYLLPDGAYAILEQKRKGGRS